MNFPSDRKLNDGEVLSAKKFLVIESGSFPDLVKKYEKAIEDWLKERR
jgi:hypothetical protein